MYDDSGMNSTSIVLYNEVILHPWYCTCTVDKARGIYILARWGNVEIVV
jgi:hypothetical protein